MSRFLFLDFEGSKIYCTTLCCLLWTGVRLHIPRLKTSGRTDKRSRASSDVSVPRLAGFSLIT